MKNRTFTILSSFLLFVAYTSCNSTNKDDSNQALNGTYAGIFTVEYVNGDTISNPVTLKFTEENEYQSSANQDRIPAGGSGTYKKKDTTINFTDVNTWTADFDWNLILKGEYQFEQNKDQLILSAYKNEVGLYKYKLRKK